MKLLKINLPEQNLSIPDDCYQRGIDIMLHVETKKNAVVLTLPSLRDEVRMRGFFKIFLFDTERNCEVNNITIRTQRDEKMNGVSEIVLESNGAGAMIVPVNGQDWMFFSPSTPKVEKTKKEKEQAEEPALSGK
jgi:hypothetical protein